MMRIVRGALSSNYVSIQEVQTSNRGKLVVLPVSVTIAVTASGDEFIK